MSELAVGGQAVLEGVMMRSGNAMITAVRRGDGHIVVRDDEWVPYSERFPILKKPLLRGALVLVESMVNGMQALSFSAKVLDNYERAKEEAEKKAASGVVADIGVDGSAAEDDTDESARDGNLAIAASLAFSLVLAVGLFIYLPHLLAGGILNVFTGEAFTAVGDVENPAFHAIAGLVKLSIFLGYVIAIRRIPDIKRVFQYHGAEHKSIHAFENKLPLTVESARGFTTLHPRCGTSFMVFVIFVSFAVFAVVFPFIPFPETLTGWKLTAVQASIKLPLMFPIAGISYEVIRMAGKHADSKLLRILSYPGFAVQHLTTAEPDDEQLEVALVSLKRALERDGKLSEPDYPACSFILAKTA